MDQSKEERGLGKAHRSWDEAFAWGIIDSLEYGVAVVAENGRFQYVNTAFAKTVKRSFQTLLGQKIDDISHADDRQVLKEAFGKVRAGQKTMYHVRLVLPDGTFVETQQTAVPHFEEKCVIGCSITLTDVTQQKKAEQQLELQRRFIEKVFDANPNILFVFDLMERRVVYQNHHIESVVGYSAAEIEQMGSGINTTLVHPEDLPRVTNQLVQMHQEKDDRIYEIEYRIRHKSGSWVWVFVRGAVFLRDSEGRGVQIIGAATDITARKRAEMAQQQSESYYQLLFNAVPNGILVANPDGYFLDANPAICQMLDYSQKEIVGTSVTEIVDPQEERNVQLMLQHFKSGQDIERVWQLRRRDGSNFQTEVTIARLPDDNLLIMLRDITEQLRKQERQRYQSLLLRSISDAVITTDLSFSIQSWNSAAESLYGWRPNEAIGHRVGDLIETRYIDIDASQVLPEFLENGFWQGEVIQRHKEGHQIYVMASITLVRDESGSPISVLAINRNITERKTAEEALRANEAQLQAIIDTVPEGVLLVAENGSLLLTNPMAEDYLKLLAPEMLGDGFTRLEGQTLVDLEPQNARSLWHEIERDGRIFGVVSQKVEDSAVDARWVVLIHDATEERRIQEHAQLQGRLAAVGQLAAGVAHDFNNIMAIVTLYTQLILRTVNLPEKAREHMETIESQSIRATELIQQILDFSRQSVLEKQPTSLTAFISDLVKIWKRTLPENIAIAFHSDSETHMVYADQTRLQQAMMNLALNARDAMPDGGTLTIRLNLVRFRKPQVRVICEIPAGEWLEIQFVDCGSGIPRTILHKVVEPFFTTKGVGKGTGLGLAQVYGIAQQHNGFLDIKTGEGAGTTVSLYFRPFEIEPSQPADELGAVVKGAGETVLLVEDNAATREALASSLEFLNYTVIEANNGDHALSILTQHDETFDMVLSDVVMPGMGGLELARTMRAWGLTVPVLLLTGHPFQNDVAELKQLDRIDWIAKPPQLEKISHKIAVMLKS